MLSAEAYSFQLKSRLAISLSWIGGYTNVVTFMVTGHVISHMTGNSTMFSNALGIGSFDGVTFFGFILACFLLGSVASALMTETARRRGRESKYVLPMAVEALMLTCFALGIDYHSHVDAAALSNQYWFCGLAAAAMGLQNATITKISGAVVRTTHVTGVVTDIGLEGVQVALWYWDQLRTMKASRLIRTLKVTRRHPPFQRVMLLISIYGSFLVGATMGTVVFHYQPTLTMAIPVAFLLWIICVDWKHPIADVRELDLVSDPELKMHGIVKSLLPEELGVYRVACNAKSIHTAPNFSQWVDRVPKRWKVIILAISPLVRFDEEAAMNLHAAVDKLQRQGKRLVLAGVTAVQFKALDAEGVSGLIEDTNLCTDLEFAIARGIDLLMSIKEEEALAWRIGHPDAQRQPPVQRIA